MLAAWESGQTERLAPSLFAYEIASVASKRVFTGDISLKDARTMLSALTSIGPRLFDPVPYLMRAVELAHEFGTRSCYDFHYVALAEHEGCEFWTGDERLANNLSGTLPWVHWVGSYAG